MSEGYIKLHRKMLEWEWYDDANTKVVFLHLLFTANWCEREWRGIAIKPGQLITGRKRLAEELGLSERAVRTALEKLSKTGEISLATTNRWTLVTIEKWSQYQLGDDGSDQQATNKMKRKRPTSDQQTANKRTTETVEISTTTGGRLTERDQQTANKPPTNDQQTATTKEDKNIYKDSISTNVDISQKANDFAIAWNSICLDLPKVKTMTDARRKKIHARMEDFSEADIIEAMTKIQESDFLSGREGGWKANFDWLFLNSTNMAKVLEGNYENKMPRRTRTETEFDAARRRIQEQYERVTSLGTRTASL